MIQLQLLVFTFRHNFANKIWLFTTSCSYLLITTLQKLIKSAKNCICSFLSLMTSIVCINEHNFEFESAIILFILANSIFIIGLELKNRLGKEKSKNGLSDLGMSSLGCRTDFIFWINESTSSVGHFFPMRFSIRNTLRIVLAVENFIFKDIAASRKGIFWQLTLSK